MKNITLKEYIRTKLGVSSQLNCLIARAYENNINSCYYKEIATIKCWKQLDSLKAKLNKLITNDYHNSYNTKINELNEFIIDRHLEDNLEFKFSNVCDINDTTESKKLNLLEQLNLLIHNLYKDLLAEKA